MSLKPYVGREPGNLALVMRPIDYKRMVEDEALDLAREFTAAEGVVVEDVLAVLDSPEAWSLVVVGGAALPHYQTMAAYFRDYVVIDPYVSTPVLPGAVIKPAAPTIVARPLQEVGPSDLSAAPTLWVFTFNVYPYLEQPLQSLRRLASPGDIAVITHWADSGQAASVRSRYLAHVFGPDDRQVRAAAATCNMQVVLEDLKDAGLAARVQQIDGDMVQATVLHLLDPQTLER